jgi:pimeloyl-ACP methyl ester carboxylesterase
MMTTPHHGVGNAARTPETITIPLRGGGHLRGDAVRGGESTVLWVHGFGSHRGGEKAEAVRLECARRGWTFAAFDFRGHGGSSGEMRELTPDRLQEDLDAIVDHLRPDRLGLVGSSMGGFAAAWFAKRNPDLIAGCVLVAPAFHFLERRWNAVSNADREAWKNTGQLTFRNEWVEAKLGYGLVADKAQWTLRELADGWHHPTLLFHGCGDDTVPDEESLEFVRWSPPGDVELRLIRDGDHRLTAYKDRIAAGAGDFFARLGMR